MHPAKREQHRCDGSRIGPVHVVYRQHDELAGRVRLAKQCGQIGTHHQRVGRCRRRGPQAKDSAADQLPDQPVRQG